MYVSCSLSAKVLLFFELHKESEVVVVIFIDFSRKGVRKCRMKVFSDSFFLSSHTATLLASRCRTEPLFLCAILVCEFFASIASLRVERIGTAVATHQGLIGVLTAGAMVDEVNESADGFFGEVAVTGSEEMRPLATGLFTRGCHARPIDTIEETVGSLEFSFYRSLFFSMRFSFLIPSFTCSRRSFSSRLCATASFA